MMKYLKAFGVALVVAVTLAIPAALLVSVPVAPAHKCKCEKGAGCASPRCPANGGEGCLCCGK